MVLPKVSAVRGTRWTGPLADVLLAVVVAAFGVAEVWVPLTSRQGHGSGVATTAGVLLACAALTQRRRHPLATMAAVPLAVALCALAAPLYVLFYGQFVPLGIAVFSVARHGRGRAPAYGAGVTALALLTMDLTVPSMRDPNELAFHWIVMALVFGAGLGLTRFQRRAAAATQRAVEAEVGAAQEAMRAVVEERARIARELHDIVAHAVSSIVVQAGAAEEAVEDDPTFARAALGAIREAGSSALADMRRVVTVLRDDDAGLTPQPGLAQLPALVESADGLKVSLAVTGQRRALPAGLDLAAYRIVQEALTNVRRHAGATRCEIRLDYRDDALVLDVADDGHGPDGRPPSGGHGLVGMRERAALYGGSVTAGAAPAGGFEVHAVLPVSP